MYTKGIRVLSSAIFTNRVIDRQKNIYNNHKTCQQKHTLTGSSLYSALQVVRDPQAALRLVPLKERLRIPEVSWSLRSCVHPRADCGTV